MREGYWQRYRASRRRLLTGAAGLGLGALALSALGCKDSEPEAEPSVPSIYSQPDNTTASAKPGGTLKTALPFDAQSYDPLTSASPLTHSLIAAYTYPKLLKFKTAVFPESANGDTEGDLAEAFELTPDRLTITLRLRQGLRWENRPPTNNRAIDAQDVLYSWNKFRTASPFRGELLYDAVNSPGSPIDTMTAPNPRTVVIRLKQPDASVFGLLAAEKPFYVMPRESDREFDPRNDVRGYGPWWLHMGESRPNQYRIFVKNPDYYLKGRPFIDRIEAVIMPEYGARLAHFKTGAIYPSMVSQDDILPTYQEKPDLLLRKSDTFATAPSSLAFGYNDAAWRDERLRQAVSLLIDRETLIDLRSNRERLAAAGLPLDVRYHTAVGAGWEGFWVNPLDEPKFGANGNYFKFNQAEARKLMAAAGFPDGIDTVFHYNGGSEYGPGYVRTAELLSGMLYENGIRAALWPHDFTHDWQPNFHLGHAPIANPGKALPGFGGLVYRFVSSQPTPATQLYSTYHRFGTRFIGMAPDGRNVHLGDPEINKAIEDMRREFDLKRQQNIGLEISRFMARKAYDIPMLPFAALNYSLSWPVLANQGVYRGWPGGSHVTETSLHHWLDATKPPLSTT